MAELRFFTGTMDSGKSTLAMQTDYNFARNGRPGLVFTSHDRAGVGKITSRIGLETPAIEVTPDLDLYAYVQTALTEGPVDYIVLDETQFYAPAQIDQLARIVDDLDINVYAYGITTDFRAELFPGSARLLELADRVEWLQLQNLCWCGARATHNARKVNGQMVLEGEQLMLGDTEDEATSAIVSYEVLCRKHHMRRELSAS